MAPLTPLSQRYGGAGGSAQVGGITINLSLDGATFTSRELAGQIAADMARELD